jgi:hypothetical protein
MTTLTESAIAKPWHREPWPWILMAGPAIVVVAGFVTLWLAVKSDDGLVADDYYRRGLAINKTISRSQAARDLGLSADVKLDTAAGRVTVTMHGGAVLPDTLYLQLVHPTRALGDQRLELRKDVKEVYSTKLTAPVGGRRLVIIEDAEHQWRLAGEATTVTQGTIVAIPQ